MTKCLQKLTTATAAALLLATTALPLAAQGPGGGMGPGGKGDGMSGSRGQMMLLMLDADQDGKITREEFRAGHTQRFETLDADQDGKISFEEMKAWRQPRNEQRMQAMFRRGDSDGDGAISRAEFDGSADQRFEWLDANDDGVLTEDEVQAGRGKPRGPGMGPSGAPVRPLPPAGQ